MIMRQPRPMVLPGPVLVHSSTRSGKAGRFDRTSPLPPPRLPPPMLLLLPPTVLLVLLCALPLGASASRSRSEPMTVELPDGSGTIEGIDLRDGPTGQFEVDAFLGVPFAQPPIKTRRWTSPTPVAPWKDVRQAKQFAPNCMQLDPPAWGTMMKNVSEDCLYLNVWTPTQQEGEQKTLTYPVLVFIHGGGYAYGGAYDTELDGSSLCDLADVVVVTIQYRLDIFGWLGSDALRSRSEDNSTGNWGAQDQRMALKWVQNNIAAFHGEPGAVCLSVAVSSLSAHASASLSLSLTRTHAHCAFRGCRARRRQPDDHLRRERWRRLGVEPGRDAQVMGAFSGGHLTKRRLSALGHEAAGGGGEELRSGRQGTELRHRCRGSGLSG
jgi:hypothetical protein